jgi:CRP-like cAMP-binding protein
VRQQDPTQALAGSDVIARLPEDIRDEFVGKCRVKAYLPREHMYFPGDAVPGPTWVVRGLASSCRLGPAGGEMPARFIWPGDLFIVSFVGHLDWPGQLTAITQTALACIPGAAFDELCGRSAELAIAWTSLLSDHMRIRMGREAQLRGLYLRPRMLKLLGAIADAFGTPTPEGILLDFPLTQGTLCCGLWSSRDETGRAMRDLERDGYLQTRPRHRILLPDRARLDEYLTRASARE